MSGTIKKIDRDRTDLDSSGDETELFAALNSSPTPTPTRTPKPTPLSVACRDSCSYYVCIESYDEYNNCIVNSVTINFNGDLIQNFNNDEYQLLIEGTCVDPLGNILDIKSADDNCYGPSINTVTNNDNCNNSNSCGSLFKIVISN